MNRCAAVVGRSVSSGHGGTHGRVVARGSRDEYRENAVAGSGRQTLRSCTAGGVRGSRSICEWRGSAREGRKRRR